MTNFLAALPFLAYALTGHLSAAFFAVLFQLFAALASAAAEIYTDLPLPIRVTWREFELMRTLATRGLYALAAAWVLLVVGHILGMPTYFGAFIAAGLMREIGVLSNKVDHELSIPRDCPEQRVNFKDACFQGIHAWAVPASELLVPIPLPLSPAAGVHAE